MEKIVKTDRWRAAESAAREAISELFAARMEARDAQGFYDEDEPIDGLTLPQRMQNAFPLGFTASVVWQDLNAEDAEHSVVGHIAVGINGMTALGLAIDSQDEYQAGS